MMKCYEASHVQRKSILIIIQYIKKKAKKSPEQ